jgi:CubicO group peptidase (beta-lactamase class C family)
MKTFKYKVLAFVIAIGIIITSGVETKAAEETSPSGIPLKELEKTVDDYMKDYIGDTANGAAVIYIHNGEIKFSKGYGYADVENKIEVDPNKTVFEYASISKTFAWTAVMQLVEQGKINLNEDMMTYFPNNFNDEIRKKLKYKKPIRVIDLMNHRAGFEDKYFNLDVTQEKILADTLEDALLLSIPNQVYEPDTVTAYSNYSTDLAGYLVECVTGKRLYDYLQDNVFDIIGMNSTTANPRYDNISYIVDNKAKGYGEDITDNGWTYVNGYPDGSVNGTAVDLARFAIAYMQEDCPLFEKQETVESLFTTSYKASEYVTGCAHGFWEYEGADLFYQHDGGHRGFTNIVAFSPKSKTGLVVLTNTGSEVYVPYGLAQLVLGDNSEISVKPGENLPNAYALDGMEFLGARRNYSDITSLYSYIEGNLQIKTIDENTIMCNGLTYVQTAPYFYELTDDKDNLVVRFVYSDLSFYCKDGKITGLSMGGTAGDDYLRCKFPYTNTGLLLQAALLLISSLVFMIAPVGRFVCML